MKARLLAAGLAIFLPTVGSAQNQPERILAFASQIEVRSNGGLAVTETIQVDAQGQQIQHGIYRDFPQLYKNGAGRRVRTGFVVQRVLRDGQPEAFHLASRENGPRVYFGSAATFVAPGRHTYELTYTTDRQLGFFQEHDELYWNVTGNGWIFSIENATATVTLPAGTDITKVTAYTGPQGARGRDFTASQETNVARFATTRRLPPENGLTIVVEWPKGHVAAPTGLTRLGYLLRDNRGLMLALAGLLVTTAYYWLAWRAVGRDPRRGVIIPRYAPPADFSPAAVRYLGWMGFDNTAFTAAILNLAVQGVIRIVERKEGIFRHKTYQLIPVRNARYQISAAEDLVRRELVGDGMPVSVVQENYASFQAARKGLRDFLAAKIQATYFQNHFPHSLLGSLLGLVSLGAILWDQVEPPAMAFLLGGFFLAPVLAIAIGCRLNRAAGGVFAGAVIFAAGVAWKYFHQPWWLVLLPMIFGMLAGMFHFLLKAYTPEGRKIMDEIEGFKRYLSVAEQDRLNLENPPERTPQLFEQFLPYALALGVEQKWSEQFAGILAAAGTAPGQSQYSPAWYSGDSWNHLGATSFATAMSASLDGAISSAATSPGSSSGGSSGGGGGGGSSGGGGGGGGGGGW